MATTTKKKKFDIYVLVNEKIISMMETGNFKWVKTWKGKNGDIVEGWNYNMQSKKPYSLLNSMMLEFDKQKYGYKSNFWLTFKQATAMGGNLAGQKSNSFVVYFTTFEINEIDARTGKNKVIPYLKYSKVFNLDQITGIDESKIPAYTEVEKFDDSSTDFLIKSYLTRENIKLNHGGDSAYYSPALDKIQLPTKDSFKNNNEYNATAFHEMIHSTGHKKRLNRLDKKNAGFGSVEYSKEELTAEIGASYLCAMFGFGDDTIQNSVAYLQGWIKKLTDNKKWLVSAMGKAEKAVDFIIKDIEIKPTPGNDKTIKNEDENHNFPATELSEKLKTKPMNFTAKADRLLSELRVYKSICGKNNLSVLNSIEIKQRGNTIKVHATNLKNDIEKEIFVSGKGSGETLVNYMDLITIIKSFGKNDIVFSVDDDDLTITDNIMTCKLTITKDDHPYLNIKELKGGLTYNIKQFMKILKLVEKSISDDETRYFMTGFCMNMVNGKIEIVGTDGRRLTLLKEYQPTRIDDVFQNLNIIVPDAKLIMETFKKSDGGDMWVDVYDNAISFSDGMSTIKLLLIEGTFPNYNRVVPDGNDCQITINRKQFLDSLKRVKPFTGKNRTGFFNIRNTNNALEIRTNENRDTGLEVDIIGDIRGMYDFCMNIDYLIDLLTVTKSENIIIEYTPRYNAQDYDKAFVFYWDENKIDKTIIMPIKKDK